MKIQIKSRYSDKILFEHNCKKNTLALTVIQACRRGADLTGADLRGAYLRGADLSGAYLRGADLRGAYLTGADLRGADLRDADLRGADLTGADLIGADLRDAYLRGADLRDAYLRGADLRGAKYADFEINKTPILISNLKYEIIIFDNHLKLGCELHTHSQWSKFTQKKIIEMDGKDALKWWKQWKEPLLQMCKIQKGK